jgi:exodeoxyribonuclease V alpha subunit
MKPQPESSTQEVLAGLVERITYHNVENGFCVLRAKVRGYRDVVTVVGHAATIAAGEWITASGGWVNDRTHGQQFRARFLSRSTLAIGPKSERLATKNSAIDSQPPQDQASHFLRSE